MAITPFLSTLVPPTAGIGPSSAYSEMPQMPVGVAQNPPSGYVWSETQGQWVPPGPNSGAMPSYNLPIQNQANPMIPGGPTTNIVGQLPALRSSGTGTAQVDPSLRPYLELGLQRAEQLFFGNQQPSLYPGQMYVSPSQQTLDALSQQEAIARGGAPVLQAGQQAYGQALSGIGQTASGAFLQGSPYQQAAIQAATRPIQQQFAESTLPALQSAFSKAGRYGSGAQERAISQAQEAASRAIGDVTTNIAYQDYARERAMQQQALGQQAALGALAPQFYGAQMLPSQTLAQIGQARETIAQAPLQEAMQRYQYEQTLPYQQLNAFLSSVYGTPLGSASYAAQQPGTNNTALTLGLLGTAASVVPKQAYSDAYDYLKGFF